MFYDRFFKVTSHLPDDDETGIAASVGVGDVEVVFDAAFAVMSVAKNSDTLGTLVDPPPELAVPLLYLKHSCGVRALGMNEDLLVEAALVVATGG
jgi:hypothetical protein